MFSHAFGSVLLFLALITPVIHPQTTRVDAPSDRIELRFNTDEADAVLAILDMHAAASAITDSDWQRLLSTEPYIRLRKREAAMHRDFTDDEFKKFVLSPELAAKASALRMEESRSGRLGTTRAGLSTRAGSHPSQGFP
jgi:hypothetical protein